MNSSEIKAIMFDIDATLIDGYFVMSKELHEALGILKNKGYKLAVNTGRPVFSAIKVLRKNNDADKLFDYYYASNGSEVYDATTGKKEVVKLIEPEKIRNLGKFFSMDYLAVAFYKDDGILQFNHPFKTKGLIDKLAARRFSTAKIINFDKVDTGAAKLVLLHEEDKSEEVEKILSNIHDDEVYFSRSGKDVFEILPVGIDKGNSVGLFALKLGIKEKDILCFGDNQNDIVALQRGRGCLVGNMYDIKEYGIECNCSGIENDGVYHFLKDNGFLE